MLPLAGVAASASGLFIFGANHFDFYRLGDSDLDNRLGLLVLSHGALLSARLAFASWGFPWRILYIALEGTSLFEKLRGTAG